MDSVPYRAWVDYVELLVVKFGGQDGPVLDLACGTGNVGLELARRGFQVTGVDRAPGMLAEARRKAHEENLPVEFIQQDMTALDLPQAFNLCVCLYDSLNYILDAEALQCTFQGVAAALHPQGLFIFDLNTEFALAMNLFTQRDLSPDTEVKYDWYSEYDPTTRLCQVRMKFFVQEQGQLREFQEVHWERAYGLEEVQEMLRRAGFTPLALYEAFSFKKPRKNSDRVYFVARRE